MAAEIQFTVDIHPKTGQEPFTSSMINVVDYEDTGIFIIKALPVTNLMTMEEFNQAIINCGVEGNFAIINPMADEPVPLLTSESGAPSTSSEGCMSFDDHGMPGGEIEYWNEGTFKLDMDYQGGGAMCAEVDQEGFAPPSSSDGFNPGGMNGTWTVSAYGGSAPEFTLDLNGDDSYPFSNADAGGEISGSLTEFICYDDFTWTAKAFFACDEALEGDTSCNVTGTWDSSGFSANATILPGPDHPVQFDEVPWALIKADAGPPPPPPPPESEDGLVQIDILGRTDDFGADYFFPTDDGCLHSFPVSSGYTVGHLKDLLAQQSAGGANVLAACDMALTNPMADDAEAELPDENTLAMCGIPGEICDASQWNEGCVNLEVRRRA